MWFVFGIEEQTLFLEFPVPEYIFDGTLVSTNLRGEFTITILTWLFLRRDTTWLFLLVETVDSCMPHNFCRVLKDGFQK